MGFLNSIGSFLKSGFNVIGFNGFGGFSRASQTKLIQDGYASNTDLYAIIKKISETGANYDYVLQIKVDGKWERVEEDKSNDTWERDLIKLLKQPNDDQDWFSYMEQSIGYLLMTGESFTKGTPIVGYEGFYSSIYIAPSNYVNVIEEDNKFPVSPESYEIDNISSGNDEKVPKSEMLFVRYFNPTDYGVESARGLSPLQAGYLSLLASNEVNIANAEILKNKGASGIISNDSGKPMTDPERTKFQDLLDKLLGGGKKAGKAIASSAKVSWTQLGMSPTDLKIIESGVFKLRQLCNLFSEDSSLYNDPANKTFNNRKEATKAHHNEAVLPVVNRLLRGLNIWLIGPYNERTGRQYRLVVDKSTIDALQEDQQAEAKKNSTVTKSLSDIATRVSEGKLDSSSAKQILMFSYKLTEDQANNIIPEGSVQKQNGE